MKFDEIIVLDPGYTVICDVCGEDYTNSQDTGGFIFGSYAYCPKCAEGHIAQIEAFGEDHLIQARCPQGIPFADFVRECR
jgi:hypothetical protein